jgi:hypothetical protein
MIARPAAVFVLLLAHSGLAQQKKPDPKAPPLPKVDEVKVDDAIRKGITYLKGITWKAGGGRHTTRELALLAMVHSGMRPGDPAFDEPFEQMLKEDPEFTYRTALRAMVLEEVDRVKYQEQLYRCAQFLVDNQCSNGQWHYGEPTTYLTPSLSPTKDVATGTPATPKPNTVVVFGASSGPQPKPPVRNKITVKKQRDGPASGDNSNSQYAALGLRACHDAGIILPKEVIQRATDWWRQSQEGASKGAPPPKNAPVATGPVTAESRGWSYQTRGSWGSMTVGAVGALVIYDYIQAKDWKRDQDVQDGVAWIGTNFSVADNPKHGNKHHYYYLYGLERAGILFGTEKFGSHEWYPEGANLLIEQQAADGSWGDTVDTCFAILFLRRATRPLVESKDASRGKK